MFTLFDQVVCGIEPFGPRELEQLHDALTVLDVPRGHRLVDTGRVADALYFVQQGCLRLFYEVEGEEKTLFVFTEGLFCAALESMLTGQPSDQVLEALEPCRLLVLPYARLLQLYDTLPRTNVLVRKVLEQRFINAQKILYAHITNTHEQRYLWLLQHYPQLLQRVPQHVLATFLGMTPVSLSRIRSRLAEGK